MSIESYLFFAVELINDQYTRSQFSDITREINKCFDMPVMLLFRHGDYLTLAVIDRRFHKRDESKDVLKKVTLIKDIRFANPHRAHIEILFDLSFDALLAKHTFTNFVALDAAWQKTLDTSLLNRQFYQELANWYFWALDHVIFPKDAPKDRDERDSVSLIRLITRVIFCWFLKEKGLISDDLFNEQKVRSLLVSLKGEENTYYTTILQNLFFATLNTEMDQPGKPPTRRFIKETKDGKESEDHMIHQVWRHAERIRDRANFERLLRGIPFLNGGLFECLDERIEQSTSSRTHEVRVDGFSVKPAKQPEVPNFLFFGPERPVDLSKAYGELRYTQAKVWPLIPLLEHYKFTVSENTPIEEEVALDPELLGHVFENLLAAYNPETDTTARKTTGSFYTPRVVVDFMVDEALIAYLESRLQATITKPKSAFEPRLRQLLSYSDKDPQFSPEEIRILIDAIDQVKILDPACGSGAFPMGALHKLVFLLGKLDPGNEEWEARQLAKARQLDVGRDAALQAVKDAFARDHGDYGRKLYLIENCLYGVDIQPIAVQIAKLRCFISLVVEQEPDEALPNLGILPLPNLETKFIAANTLFGLHRQSEKQMTFREHNIEAKRVELRAVRHEHFLARRYSEKKALRKRDKKLREELAELLKSSQPFPGPEADMVAHWDPYHADRAAAFFDPEWMFSLVPYLQRSPGTWRGNFSFINETGGQMELVSSRSITGFDIIIGNPPYVRQEELKKRKAFEGLPDLERPLKDVLKDDYFCYTGVADLYVYFYEKAFDLLALGGVLCFISSNKYFRAGYGEKLRHFLVTNGDVRLVVDFGDEPVFTSIAYPSIILVQKVRETRDKHALASVPKDVKKWQGLVPAEAQVRTLNWEPGPSIEEFPEILSQQGFTVPQQELIPDGWRLESPLKLRLLEKLRHVGTPLGEYVEGQFFNGVKTGLNDAFVIDEQTRNKLITEHKTSAEVLKPFLRGRDVKRWSVVSPSLWLIYVPWHFPLHEDNTITSASKKAEEAFRKQYPAIYTYLARFRSDLEIRDKAETGIRYEWYALARPRLESSAAFEQTKIVIPTIANDVEYAVDERGHYSNDKTTVCLTKNPEFLLSLLNSKVLWWVMRQTAATKQGGFYKFKPMYVAKLPIAIGDMQAERQITQLAKKVIAKKKKDPGAFVSDLEGEIDSLVAHLYGLTEDEYRLILDDLALPDPVRVAALNAYRETAQTLHNEEGQAHFEA